MPRFAAHETGRVLDEAVKVGFGFLSASTARTAAIRVAAFDVARRLAVVVGAAAQTPIGPLCDALIGAGRHKVARLHALVAQLDRARGGLVADAAALLTRDGLLRDKNKSIMQRERERGTKKEKVQSKISQSESRHGNLAISI